MVVVSAVTKSRAPPSTLIVPLLKTLIDPFKEPLRKRNYSVWAPHLRSMLTSLGPSLWAPCISMLYGYPTLLGFMNKGVYMACVLVCDPILASRVLGMTLNYTTTSL